MEGVKSFLETSTIHGLSHIATGSKLAKLFWIFVVIFGFTGASIIIHQSFQDWAINPITTTIETLPISKIILPKVTVCPPKNTFTKLNHKLLILENITLEKYAREIMTHYVAEQIQNHNFKEAMSNLSQVEDENRYYNWYNQHTELTLPYWGPAADSSCTSIECAKFHFRYYFTTFATSGFLSTQSFGEKFEADSIRKDLFIYFELKVPLLHQEDENVTVHFEVKKNSMIGIETYDGEINSQSNFTPPGLSKSLKLYRYVSMHDINNLDLNMMPGFSIKWQYNAENITVDKFSESSTFTRFDKLKELFMNHT